MFDGGLHHLHAWITFGSASYPASRHVDFYVSALLAIAILTLLHLRPLHYGVLLPEMPGAEHVLLDGQVVPLVDKPPPQNLTRKVNLIFVEKIEAIYFTHSHRSQLVRRVFLSLALLLSFVAATVILMVAYLEANTESQGPKRAYALLLSMIMCLCILACLSQLSNTRSVPEQPRSQ